jgi:hypothetical protein
LQLRVQSSGDLTDWSDLPGGAQMADSSGTWTLLATNMPVGAQYFRVVASAPAYADRISTALGTFTIEASLPVIAKTISSSTNYSLQSVGEMQNPAIVLLEAIDGASTFCTVGDKDEYIAALALAGEQYAFTELAINPGQSLTLPAVDVLPNASIVLKGTINGDVALISQDGNGIVAQGGGNIVAQGGGNITFDTGTAAIVAQGGGNIVAQGGGNIVAQGGGNIVAQGGGNVVVSPQAAENALASLIQKKGQIKPFDLTQPTFTGQMMINGDYSQFPGTELVIGIAGTNTLNDGAQQFDQLVVSGTANLIGGMIAFGLLDPDDQTNQADVFQPPDGATFDVVVASNIVVNALAVSGPIWGDGQFFSGSVVTRDDGLQAVRLTATHIPPRIFLQSARSALQLIYATNFTGYAVQSATSLSSSNWTTFSTGTNVVMLSPTNSSRFFRLSKP